MPNVSIIATSLAGAPFNIGYLIIGKKPDGSVYSPAGVTVNNQAAGLFTNCQYARVEHDGLSTANKAYIGDSNVSSTNKGMTILRGDNEPLFPTVGNSIHLADKYVTFDAIGGTSAILNVSWEVL